MPMCILNACKIQYTLTQFHMHNATHIGSQPASRPTPATSFACPEFQSDSFESDTCTANSRQQFMNTSNYKAKGTKLIKTARASVAK